MGVLKMDGFSYFIFKVRSTEYGLLVENDIGKLTFQGTRYLGFERNRD